MICLPMLPIPADGGGRPESIRLLTVHFCPQGQGFSPWGTMIVRWDPPLNPYDAIHGGFANVPGVWFPARELVQGPDGKLYGLPFVPKRPPQ